MEMKKRGIKIMNDLFYLEINLQNLKHNITNLKSLLKPKTSFMAVVKANAYGHGMVECAKTAVEAGADWLGVVNIKEALELRKRKIVKPILVLGYVNPRDLKLARQNNISVSIINNDQIQALIQDEISHKARLKIHLKIETGLNRLGFVVIKNNQFDLRELVNIIDKLKKKKDIFIEGIYSHLASVEEDLFTTHGQYKLFNDVLNDLKKYGINIPIKHIGASAATILLPKTHFNMVRCGISIYGLWPSKEVKKAFQKFKNDKDFLKPVLTYKTKIIQIKSVEKNEKIGYGRTFTAKKPTSVAIIPVGYAEGLDRRLSNPGQKGEVLINGQRCPIVGRICMNMSVVDITKIKDQKSQPEADRPLDEKIKNNEAIIIGKQGDDEITVDEMAEKLKTINYEITTRLPENIKRLYL